MPNLPMKQNAMSKIFQNILDIGLKNGFTRGIIANFMSQKFSRRLIDYVSRNDSPDLTETMKLLSSMKDKTISNPLTLDKLVETVRAKRNVLLDEDLEKVINPIINSIEPRKRPDFLIAFFEAIHKKVNELNYIVRSTLETIYSSIDFNEVSQEKMDVIVREATSLVDDSYEQTLFSNLTTEQKNKYFMNFIAKKSFRDMDITEYNLKNIEELFEQIPEEDRLEQYRKVLEIFKLEPKPIIPSDYEIVKAFKQLKEEERIDVLEETVNIIRNVRTNKNDDFIIFLGAIPFEIQEKYYLEAFELCKEQMELLPAYLSNLDKSLHKNISNDVIEQALKSDKSVKETIANLNSDDRNQIFINILGGSTEEPNFINLINFLNQLDEKDNILKDLESFSIENNIEIISQEKISEFTKGEYNKSEKLKKLIKIEINRLKNICQSNPNEEVYKGTVEKIKAITRLEGTGVLIDILSSLDQKNKERLFNHTLNNPEDLELANEWLKKSTIKDIIDSFNGTLFFSRETINKLITSDNTIAIKTLLLDKDVDTEKIIELSTYAQLQQGDSIDISSVIKNLYIKQPDKQKFNQSLNDIYNLFTYNNVPDFIKNFRLFQLGAYYDKENLKIKSFQNLSKQERDRLILEDLFKISLDSNNPSLKDFLNIIVEGKKITTELQQNPEENIKKLSKEKLAILTQYRDTLFDLHNITKEIRETNKPAVEKTEDVLTDLRNLISIYSDNQQHNLNSKNVVFNPHLIINELFKDFITTTIRPRDLLEYMERKKTEADDRHLEIEKKLKNGTMHLEEGDFVKGIVEFERFIPSILRDGVKGGEFNQETSHSDMTPLDADFGYISKANLSVEGATDSQIISTTISNGYGKTFLVLKKYSERLQNGNSEVFGEGTFNGSQDFYMNYGENEYDPSNQRNSAFIRTGIPILDADYIVSLEWRYEYGYEMAMAGVYIPVVDEQGKVIFSSEDYRKIREQMRGLSQYGAEDIQLSENVKNVDALFSTYKKITSKSEDIVEQEIEKVRELIDGKPDSVTEKKRQATIEFIKDFLRSKGIAVTNNLSQNLSSRTAELIDTGSTGRGTNVPGDGDFDFMLRHNLPPQIIGALGDKVRELTKGEFKNVGDGFRASNVILPNGETADIDITTAPKKLSLSYSSDMCVQDRLNNIKENNPQEYAYVQANIIMAKKILKEKGIYKKIGSDGATEHGGFGGLGVENWILQNGGSFEEAIRTFLETANEVESEVSNKEDRYKEFQKRYPIFDFGFNHREGKDKHDKFSGFFNYTPETGFEYVVKSLTEIQKSIEEEKIQKPKEEILETPVMKSISPEGFAEAGEKKEVLRNRFSFARMKSLLAKLISNEERAGIKKSAEEGPEFD